MAPGGLGQVDWPVVVAVVAVGMMQATLNQVVDVVPVGNRFVTAVGAVDMSRFVACQVLSRSASIGIPVTDLEAMLVHVISVGMMEMPIVQVVNVVLMLDRGVTAAGAVGVVVTFVNVAFSHFGSPAANQNQPLSQVLFISISDSH